MRHDGGWHRPSSRRRAGGVAGPIAAGLAAALALAAPALTHAQAPASAEASAGDRAVLLGTQGLEAYEAGRFAEAHGRFAEAQSLSPSPVFVLFMARCQRKLGTLLDARARYREVVTWEVDAGAPEAWSRARADARNELAALEPLVPWVVVEVHGAQGATSAEVLVDGVRTEAGRVEVDPGKHRVSARAGVRRVERSIDVAEGAGAISVVLELPAIATPRVAARPPLPLAARREQGPLWPAVTAFALGGAGVVAGSITGVMAMSRASDAKRANCQGNACPLALRGDKETEMATVHDGLAVASTIAFVAGGLALAGGTVLLITRPGGAPAIEARVAPGGATVRGYF